MSAYKTEQCRVVHRGREFHFVSYEGVASNPKLGHDAVPATWYLMRAGKRWAAMPQDFDQPLVELEAALHAWLDAHVFGSRRKHSRNGDAIEDSGGEALAP